MGIASTIISALFGSNRNVIKETAEVFRVNAEAQDQRYADQTQAALAQFAAEFQHQRTGNFDRFIDGLNRIPRPMMALGCIGLMVSAMIDPLWFSARMRGLALVPEPLWWLIGVVVSFYFGARTLEKNMGTRNVSALFQAGQPAAKQAAPEAEKSGDGNAALEEWKSNNG